MTVNITFGFKLINVTPTWFFVKCFIHILGTGIAKFWNSLNWALYSYFDWNSIEFEPYVDICGFLTFWLFMCLPSALTFWGDQSRNSWCLWGKVWTCIADFRNIASCVQKLSWVKSQVDSQTQRGELNLRNRSLIQL